MSKMKPFLQTALTVLAVLVVYKLIVQPAVIKNETLAKYLPAV
jgi:hypothetical protein